MARMWQGLIEKKDLSSRPFIPINKPGGSGAEALRYLQDKEGDDHVIMVTLNSFYTTPIIQKDLGVDVTKFTPIGRMALDTFLLWVHADRNDITDLDSYVSAVKSTGKSWKVGGTGSGQEDSILTAMMEDAFGYEVTYIPFPGGGTVAKNLIGKHIDSTVNNPSEQNEFYRAGKQASGPVQRARFGLPGHSHREGAGSRHRVLHAAFHQRPPRHVGGRAGVVHGPVQDPVRVRGMADVLHR